MNTTAMLYLIVPVQSMTALDGQRLEAETNCTDPAIWERLAAAYEMQGRDCMAASCRRRASHYAKQQEAELENYDR